MRAQTEMGTQEILVTHRVEREETDNYSDVQRGCDANTCVPVCVFLSQLGQ